jgi:hypothetical protein
MYTKCQTTTNTCACDGSTPLGCGTCGIWSFETNSLEGWSINTAPSGTQTSADSGGLKADPAYSTSGGKYSLSIGFDGTKGGSFIQFQVSFCSTVVTRLSAHVHFVGNHPSAIATSMIIDGGAGLTGTLTGTDVDMSGAVSGTATYLLMYVVAPGAMGTVYIDNVRVN